MDKLPNELKDRVEKLKQLRNKMRIANQDNRKDVYKEYQTNKQDINEEIRNKKNVKELKS
jgi:hypothetical protein